MGNVFKVDGKVKIKALFISVFITFFICLLGAYASQPYFSDYLTLEKPIFSPPSFVFSVVWTILYILMSIAVYRIYMKKYIKIRISNAIILYGLQLLLNCFWPVLFFRLRLYAISFLELLILLIFILLTFFEFFKKDKVASFLIIPYIAWVSFAAVLNYTIWMMN